MQGNPAKPKGIEGIKMLERMNNSHKPLRDWGFSHVKFEDNLTMLDVGCGGGATIKDLLSYSKNSIVYGIDYSIDSVNKSKLYNKEDDEKRVFVSLGNVKKLQFKENTFDKITAVETIYFWEDIENCFKEIKRVLKNNGEFIILCEVSDPSQYDWSFIKEYSKIYPALELEKLLQDAGFKNIISYKGEGEYILVSANK